MNAFLHKEEGVFVIKEDENFKIWRYIRRISSKHPNLTKHFKG
jgi:hypothetical protein